MRLNFFKNIFKRASYQEKFLSGHDVFSRGTVSGVSVSEENAMMYATLFACVRLISETIASLPLFLYRRTADGGRERVSGHPLSKLLTRNPSENVNSFSFREALQAHLLLWGNAYARIIFGNSRPVSFEIIKPSQVQIVKDTEKERYIYHCYNDFGKSFVLPKSDILHIVGLGYDGVFGLSPVALAKETIGACFAVNSFASSFFGSGAHPAGIVEYPTKLSAKYLGIMA